LGISENIFEKSCNAFWSTCVYSVIPSCSCQKSEGQHFSHSSPRRLTYVTAFRPGLRYNEGRNLGPSCRRSGRAGVFPVAPPPRGEKGRVRWLRHSSRR
jgi:hypothetical protein